MVDQGPRGAPLYQDLEPAYTELLKTLWYASQQYKTVGDSGRKGVDIACQAVVHFMGVRHLPPDLAIPFLAIRQALIDFDKGVNPELLSRGGAKERSRSGVKKHLRRWASMCLEVLIEKGEPLDIAGDYVARHVAKWPGIGPQKITGKTIQNWRDTERRRIAGPERALFDTLRADLLGLDNPKGEVDRVLREGAPGIPDSRES